MKIDLPPFEVWEQLNSKVSQHFNIADETTVRCYPGLATAIFELAQGAAQFYSHKKSIGLVPGKNPILHLILPWFYKESYNVQIAPEGVPLREWAETLSKDTCFVIACEDHAVTGELVDLQETEKFLNEKRIYFFKISHSRHYYWNSGAQPFTTRICSYDPRTAVAFLGSRFKAPTLVVSHLDWQTELFLESLRQSQTRANESRSKVLSFEANLPPGFQPLLSTESRCFDRSLIYTQSAGGEALQSYLAAALKLKLQKPGWENVLETTHLCRWGGTKTYEAWWNSRPEESILRGLLILGVEILEHPELKGHLEDALRECQIVDVT